jgi:ribose/xylose/arabinose/galactoside ABC-type transport system permease subunit
MSRRRRIPSVGGIWLVTAALFVVGWVLQPNSFTANQFLNVLQVASFVGIVAIGQTVVILTGGIDLSVSGVVTLVNVVSALVMKGDAGRIVPTVFLCLGIGIAVGVVNGLLVTKARIVPLIVTLAMQAVLFGTALLLTGGIPSGGVPKEFLFLGQGRVFSFPVAAIVWIALTVAFAFVTRRMTFGRCLYATGSNARAAHMAGVPVDPTLIAAYASSGLTAAIAGLVLTAYIGLPALQSGDKYQLLSIAAVAVGGTALSGGIGGVVLSAGGALFVTELGSITNVLQVGTGAQFFIQGAAIVLGTALYSLAQRRRAASPMPAPSDPGIAPRHAEGGVPRPDGNAAR